MDMMKMPENVTFMQRHAVFGIKPSPQLVEWLEQRTTANERAMRREVKEVFETISAMLTLLSDPVAREILNLITLHIMNTPRKVHFTASSMSGAIIKRYGDNETVKQQFFPRRISKALNRFEREFSVLFKRTDFLFEGCRHYIFEESRGAEAANQDKGVAV